MSVHAEEQCHVPRLDFELTPGCDHRCGHCYNVWNASPGDAQAGVVTSSQLPTPELKGLMSRVVGDSGAQHITITGGEPLLRRDALELIAHACSLVKTVGIITNGSHVTAEVAAHFARHGVRSVQLTLLAADRALHDRLKGAVCYDDTLRAAVRLVQARVPVQVCYVAMRDNDGQLGPVMELCAALGLRALSYNRMSPTGGAIHHIERLMPSADAIERDLDTAERLGRRYGISVGTAMPIPPCLVRIDRYSWVRFGFCSTGSASPNTVIDGRGDVRSCNLSSTVLGNLVEQDWAEIFANPYPQEFKRTVPEMCRGCFYERSCQGGCKESAHATFGSHAHPEPLVWLAQDPARRVELAARVAQHAPVEV